ncbi:MAG: rhodanese-like domain-containing protein [Solirubrobacterales bacterium]
MPETIKAKDARQDVASNELFVVDVRTEAEWADDAERIPGSTHIPAEDLNEKLKELDLAEDQRILIVCADGERSAKVAEDLDGDGHEVVTLKGGVKGWKKEGLLTQPSVDLAPAKGEGEEPVEKPDDEEDSE